MATAVYFETCQLCGAEAVGQTRDEAVTKLKNHECLEFPDFGELGELA
jgi:hypothetical protein